MCGITGFLALNQDLEWDQEQSIDLMTDSMAHRGPDARGTWSDANNGVWLGHRRLSVIDLSEQGHQPMHSSDGRWIITANGEVYNYESLRRDLEAEGVRFRGRSDTEVLLEAVAHWGLEKTLVAATGMFAIAVWDRKKRRLHLIRDRLGEKPLYYGWVGDTFIFASELKAIKCHPMFHGSIDRSALAKFLRYGYVPSPQSIYEGIQKLPPGHMLNVSPRGRPREHTVELYWSLAQVVQEGRANQLTSFGGAVDGLEAVLDKTARKFMASDVPLGVFLSGGIDSSAITAFMQKVNEKPTRTFTIGFEEDGYNEADHARAIANHLNTDHKEFYVDSDTALKVVPKLPQLYDEPFADSSQIPTHLVSKIAKEHVTVALSGDGGDELFGGYNRHVQAGRIWRTLQRIPRPGRKLVSYLIGGMPIGVLTRNNGHHQVTSEQYEKLKAAIGANDLSDFYERILTVSHGTNASVYEGSTGLDSATWMQPGGNGDLTAEEYMMFRDAVGYLPDDILVKVDRASMGVGLEIRAPFLDPEMVAFSWSLPIGWKIHKRQGKQILRKALYRHIPQELLERPKAGFAVPLESWLRDPLREWAETLIDSRRVQQEGYLRRDIVEKKWREHQSGRKNHHHALWSILMFQSWLERHKSESLASCEPKSLNAQMA